VQLLDIAPYVRLIASHDLACETERAKRLLSLGEKRIRLTRASRSAMEGGRREETRARRERWWDPSVNLRCLLATGGSWMEACEAGILDDGGESDERHVQEGEADACG
jgi:hypothetical protein